MTENILRSGRDPIAALAELITPSARKRLGFRFQDIGSEPKRLRPPESPRPSPAAETADEHRYQDKAYATNDDARSTDEEYTNGQSRYRRSSLVLLLAILGLAILGVAGAFGYRAIFGGPISKANKTAPAAAVVESNNATKTDRAGTRLSSTKR